MNLKLHLGDCLSAMHSMPDGSVDVIVTSPPYNLGTKYSRHKDNGPRVEFIAWFVERLKQMQRILARDGSLFLNVGASPSNPFLPHQIALHTAQMFRLQNTFHWIKAITVMRKLQGPFYRPLSEPLSVGHFKPITSKRFVNDLHEYVFHFTHTGDIEIDRLAVGVPFADKSNIARRGHAADLRCRGNTWFIPYDTIQKRDKDRPHPATFPVALVDNCLRIASPGNTATVLDPFLGIGTSAIAAKKYGAAEFIGCEIDPGYMKEAKRRIKNAS